MKTMKKNMVAALFLAIVLMIGAGASAADKAQRSLFRVGNLTCVSCLNSIQAELEGIAGVLGMDALLDQGIVAVDHDPQLDPEQIAVAVSALGYPASLIGIQEIEYSQVASFRRGGSGGCGGSGGGGCGGPGASSAGNGLVAWQPMSKGVPVAWTIMAVDNLTCISCLNSIEEGLRGLPGTIGMKGDLSSGRVAVLHLPGLSGQEVAATVAALGYPAQVADSAVAVTGAEIIPSARGASAGGCSTGSGRSPCNATVSAWQELYKRYFSKNN